MVAPRERSPFPSFTEKWHTDSYAAISPHREALSLKGKSIVIPGGGAGIGARAVRSFAEAGATNIAILGRREKNLQDTAASVSESFPSVTISTYVADITSADEVNRAVAVFAGRVGELHVLINNAGMGEPGTVIRDGDSSLLTEHLSANVKGSFIVVQAFLRHARRDAIVLNVASLVGFMVLGPGVSAYSVSKAASTHLFACVQAENPQLRVVNVQPGAIDTDMWRKTGLPAMDDSSLPANFLVWATSEEAAFVKGKFVFANWDVEEMIEKAVGIRQPGALEMWIDGLEHK